ncbi:SUMF1/EgtB/PvdO family nonheme iron enzyme [bacterium]|nr:SUMF1/EgtB/PvdO family nonheme iron enzyme [bacterium]
MNGARLTALILILALATVFVLSCSSGNLTTPHADDTNPPQAGVPDAFPLLTFPPSGANSPSRRISESEVVTNGNAWVEEAGAGNRDGSQAESYVIMPDGNESYAWARYSIGDMYSELPVSGAFNVLSTPAHPGGEDDLPLNYWIGFSNYTDYTWEWFGPYHVPMSIEINNEALDLVDRYIDGTGALGFVVVADRTGIVADPETNPDGLTAVEIVSTITTVEAAEEVPNSPISTDIFDVTDSTSAGAGGGSRGVSQMVNDSRVTLTWDHCEALAPEAEDWEASSYRVYRQGPDDTAPVLIGSVLAPQELYVDPDNNFIQEPALPPPTPGAHSTYYLQAVNSVGVAQMSAGHSITLGIKAPAYVRGELTIPGDAAFLRWSEVPGAVSYRITRTVQEPVALDTTTQTTYTDNTLPEQTFGTYNIVAVGRAAESVPSDPFWVYMPGPGVQIILDNGVTIDFVEVPAGTLQLGSPGGEWMRANTNPPPDSNEEPYQAVNLGYYYIMRTEITNAMWAAFMDAGGYAEPLYWDGFWAWRENEGIVEPLFWKTGQHNSGTAYPDYPVVGVSFEEVYAFSKWLNTLSLDTVRLPSEAEWEYAAEGPRQRNQIWLFPWPEIGPLLGGVYNDGDDGQDMTRANCGLNLSPDDYPETAPVGTFRLGRSWCGVLDMAGNVHEWTAEQWRESYPAFYAVEPFQGGRVTIRGGGYDSEIRELRTSFRKGFVAENREMPCVGGRVVMIPR